MCFSADLPLWIKRIKTEKKDYRMNYLERNVLILHIFHIECLSKVLTNEIHIACTVFCSMFTWSWLADNLAAFSLPRILPHPLVYYTLSTLRPKCCGFRLWKNSSEPHPAKPLVSSSIYDTARKKHIQKTATCCTLRTTYLMMKSLILFMYFPCSQESCST